jgi:hypothetical protein
LRISTEIRLVSIVRTRTVRRLILRDQVGEKGVGGLRWA